MLALVRVTATVLRLGMVGAPQPLLARRAERCVWRRERLGGPPLWVAAVSPVVVLSWRWDCKVCSFAIVGRSIDRLEALFSADDARCREDGGSGCIAEGVVIEGADADGGDAGRGCVAVTEVGGMVEGLVGFRDVGW